MAQVIGHGGETPGAEALAEDIRQSLELLRRRL